MQPWKVSAGLTATLAGFAVLVVNSRLAWLAPFWRVILAEYGLAIAIHLGLALATIAAVFCGVVRAAGLTDVGRRVDLVERSIRREEGGPELAEAPGGMPMATRTDSKDLSARMCPGNTPSRNGTIYSGRFLERLVVVLEDFARVGILTNITAGPRRSECGIMR